MRLHNGNDDAILTRDLWLHNAGSAAGSAFIVISTRRRYVLKTRAMRFVVFLLCSEVENARAWRVTFRASLLGRFKSLRRAHPLPESCVATSLHLCLRLQSLIDWDFHSCGKVPFPCHVDGDAHARARLPGHPLSSGGRVLTSRCEAAAGACVRAVSAAQGEV